MSRRRLLRFAAPAAFLLAATIAGLLIRSGLDVAESRPTTTRAVPHRIERATTLPTAPPAPRAKARYYVIASGDTFELLAGRFGTTIERLVELNPGVEPTALTPGQRVRIR